FFTGIGELRVIERQLRRRNSELRIAVESLQTVRREKIFRIPIVNFAGATHPKGAGVEAGNTLDSAPLGENPVPKICAPTSDASDGPNPGDNGASSAHAVTGLAWPSTYAFIQR